MLTCPPARFPYSAPYVCSRTLYSRTASTPSNWELAPEGVMNWWVAFPPIQSTPLIRNRLVSCRWPATEKAGKPPPPPMFEALLTTPALSSRSRSKLRPFSGRSLTCCSVMSPDVELSVVFTSGASSLTVICSAVPPTSKVRGTAEQITVSEEAPLVNTTLSSTSGLITEQQVKDLPLNGRSFDRLLELNAGVVNNASNMGGGGGFPAFSVAGHRQETNRFLINGVDWIGGNATHQFITPSGASSQLLGVEAVREYNVLEHTYGAEYGKRAGGQVSIVTSSGTNQWHGGLFEYHRNSALDAKNFFEDAKGPFKRHQFGGTIGGPVMKDKLFVFGNYEGFTQRLAQSTRSIYPDVKSRQ